MDEITQLFVDYKNEHRVTENKSRKDSGTMTFELSENATLAIAAASILFSAAICLGVCCCIRQLQQMNKKVKLAALGRQGLEFQHTGRSGGDRGGNTARHMRRLETDAPMDPNAVADTEADNIENMK